jgi:hypothetical protein
MSKFTQNLMKPKVNYNTFPNSEMRALNVEELESSSKIDLKDASWWMSIKDANRFRAPVTTKLSK